MYKCISEERAIYFVKERYGLFTSQPSKSVLHPSLPCPDLYSLHYLGFFTSLTLGTEIVGEKRGQGIYSHYSAKLYFLYLMATAPVR